jgi:hypothetical protein
LAYVKMIGGSESGEVVCLKYQRSAGINNGNMRGEVLWSLLYFCLIFTTYLPPLMSLVQPHKLQIEAQKPQFDRKIDFLRPIPKV